MFIKITLRLTWLYIYTYLNNDSRTVTLFETNLHKPHQSLGILLFKTLHNNVLQLLNKKPIKLLKFIIKLLIYCKLVSYLSIYICIYVTIYSVIYINIMQLMLCLRIYMCMYLTSYLFSYSLACFNII